LGVDLPITFVGDMPRQLLALSAWRALQIDIKEVKCGDLLFTKNKANRKRLSHLALFIEVDQIFHCCLSLKTAGIQSADAFFSSYAQELNFKQMVRYIDPRNKELREKYKGIFIVE
jgi:hypothetical protein